VRKMCRQKPLSHVWARGWGEGLIRAATGAWLLLFLSACITRPPPPPPVADISEAERIAWLHAHPDWSFTGRVALKQPGKGGSGRIEWQQHGSQYQVRLSAPVTRQSWQLTGDLISGHGRIEGIAGGPLESEDAEALLWEATGWEIPLRLLPDWVRGLGADDARPHEMQQSGWGITWPQWHPPLDARPSLPKRIDAVRGEGADAPRIRLLIDQWAFP